MPSLLEPEEARYHWLHGYAAAWLALEAADEAGPSIRKTGRATTARFRAQQQARTIVRPEGTVCAIHYYTIAVNHPHDMDVSHLVQAQSIVQQQLEVPVASACVQHHSAIFDPKGTL